MGGAYTKGYSCRHAGYVYCMTMCMKPKTLKCLQISDLVKTPLFLAFLCPIEKSSLAFCPKKWMPH